MSSYPESSKVEGFSNLFRELAGFAPVSAELMHFSSVFHRAIFLAKTNRFCLLSTLFLAAAEFVPAYPRKLLA
jgi:hypothetical protein